jgi:hypothetical protein
MTSIKICIPLMLIIFIRTYWMSLPVKRMQKMYHVLFATTNVVICVMKKYSCKNKI